MSSLVCAYGSGSEVDESCSETSLSESQQLQNHISLLPSGQVIADFSASSSSEDSCDEEAVPKKKQKLTKRKHTSSNSLLPGAFDALEASVKPSFLENAAPTKNSRCLEFDAEAPPAEAEKHRADQVTKTGQGQRPPVKPSSVFVPDAKLKETREQNKKKNAGKVKGEFKRKSETARGGEKERVRWD